MILALDATLVTRGPSGEREIAAADFFQSLFETALQPDELLTEIRVPRPAEPGWGFQKFTKRGIDWAIVGVAVQGRSVGLVNMGRPRCTPRPPNGPWPGVPPPATPPRWPPRARPRPPTITPAPASASTWPASSSGAPWSKPPPPPSALRFVRRALEQAPDSPAVTCAARSRRGQRAVPGPRPGSRRPARARRKPPDNGLCPARGGDAGPGTAATALARIRRSSDATGNGGIAGHTVA